jgi:hypothetical protein
MADSAALRSGLGRFARVTGQNRLEDDVPSRRQDA